MGREQVASIDASQSPPKATPSSPAELYSDTHLQWIIMIIAITTVTSRHVELTLSSGVAIGMTLVHTNSHKVPACLLVPVALYDTSIILPHFSVPRDLYVGEKLHCISLR